MPANLAAGELYMDEKRAPVERVAERLQNSWESRNLLTTECFWRQRKRDIRQAAGRVGTQSGSSHVVQAWHRMPEAGIAVSRASG